jgi:hypothetical protein
MIKLVYSVLSRKLFIICFLTVLWLNKPRRPSQWCLVSPLVLPLSPWLGAGCVTRDMELSIFLLQQYAGVCGS